MNISESHNMPGTVLWSSHMSLSVKWNVYCYLSILAKITYYSLTDSGRQVPLHSEGSSKGGILVATPAQPSTYHSIQLM